MQLSRFLILTLTALLLSAGTVTAQSLPDGAAQALQRGEQTMEEALRTYSTHYPDRPLWQETFSHALDALSIAPEHPQTLAFLARAYSLSGWFGPGYEAWLDYLDHGYRLSPDDTPIFSEVAHRQAYSFYERGRVELALETYRQLIDAVPFDLDAHVWVGRILLEQGRPEEAIAYWQTVVERNPGDDRAQYFLQLARDQARWGTDAVNAFREGVSHYEQGQMEQARERFARATSHNRIYPEAWAWLGRVAFEQGNFEDARTYYRNASELDPDNQTYRYFFEESGRRLEG